MSFGDTHGISPFQYSMSPLSRVSAPCEPTDVLYHGYAANVPELACPNGLHSLRHLPQQPQISSSACFSSASISSNGRGGV